MVVAAASPSSAPPSAGRPHPTYKEMIVQALTELREPSGSTRRAIANYIADHFSGLHASHDALLSVHLRRLKSQGQLRLFSGYTYRLSTAAAAPPPQQQRRGRGRPPKAASPPGRKRGRPRKNPDLAPSAPALVFQGPKRGPGRPRKDAVPSGVNSCPVARPPPPGDGVKRGPGRPRKDSYPAAPPPAPSEGPGRPRRNATPVSLLLSGKRKPGRPPKSAVSMRGSSESASVSPPKDLVVGKRKRGRPPKVKTPPGMQLVAMQSADAVLPLPKRGPGRPRKEKTVGDQAGSMQNGGDARGLQECGTSLTKRPLETETTETGLAALVEKRGRGRPRKKNPSATRSAETGDAASMGIKRGRGRPRKNFPWAAKSAETEDAASTGIKRGRGRPRKNYPPAPTSAETGDATSTGIKRGRGRPRKDRSFETGFVAAAVEVSRHLTEGRPETDDTLVSGKETETEGICLHETMDAGPADAGGVLVSGEKASILTVDAGSKMLGADPMDSNLGTTSL
ncbi:hypothetical protein ACP70R_033770 [Stipagrostis hirtigluma subsp. patula]